MEEGIYIDTEAVDSLATTSTDIATSNSIQAEGAYMSFQENRQPQNQAPGLNDFPKSVDCGVYGQHDPKQKKWPFKRKPKPKSVALENPMYERTINIPFHKTISGQISPTPSNSLPQIEISQYENVDLPVNSSATRQEPFYLEAGCFGSQDHHESDDSMVQDSNISSYNSATREEPLYLEADVFGSQNHESDGSTVHASNPSSYNSDSSLTSYEDVEGDANHIYEPVDDFKGAPEATDTASLPYSSIPLPPIPDEQIEDIKEKRRKKRNHVIQELIQTEEDYLVDVVVTIEDIMKPLLERELQLDLKIETLFGNIEQIRDFSTQLLASLKEASINHHGTDDIDVGLVFIDHIRAMKDVYMIYCRNHDDASALLEKYEEDPEFQVPVQECLNNVKNKVNTFDLGSFLIKPVQRILKYPLLFRELVKLTDVPQARQSTDSYEHIIKAVKLIQDVANDINEDKRRKDLVRKYRKGSQENTKFSGKMSRLSLHSVKKKGARISRRIGHATGLNQTETVDENFNLLVQKFKDLEKTVKTFLVNSDQYGNRCRDLLNLEHLLTEHMTDLSASDHTPTIVAYGTAMKRVADHLYRKFHDQTQLRVHTPLSAVLVRFKGPQAIIDKRFDKLLDFENSQKNSDSKEKVQMAKNVYEALNQQLLNELPTLCELATKLLEECMALFIRLQIRFQQNMLEVLWPILEMCKKEMGKAVSNDLDKTKIMEHFNFDHNQVLVSMRDLTVIPASFCAITSSPSVQSRSSKTETIRSQSNHLSPVTQTQAQKQELLNKYKSKDIFVATSSYSSSDKVDISCSLNDVIAVIKKQDPLGNTAKWFCDNGVGMGFLPSVILQVRQQTDRRTPSPLPRRDKSPTPSTRSSGSVDSFSSPSINPTLKRSSLSPSPYSVRQGLYGQVGSPGREANLSSEQEDMILQDAFQAEEEMLDDTEYGEVTYSNPKERYRVEFNFKARTTLELTVTESELLNLIVPHDLEGNTEWWLMSNSEGKQGYVPANYMSLAEYL